MMVSTNNSHPLEYLSVLQNVGKPMLVKEPFPYILIDNALPAVIANSLTEEFPLPLFDSYKEKYQSPNNKRIDISLAASRAIQNVPQIWQDFLEYHCSAHFFNKLIDIFGEEIINLYPEQYKSIDELRKLNIGIHREDDISTKDIVLDTAMSINTPVIKAGTVRAIHTDHGDKLYTGLLYLKRPQDDSTGGNLQILKWKNSYSLLKKRFVYQEGVDPKHTEIVKEVAYGNNTLIMFINSLDALHAVTPRSVTPHDRTFVNFIGITKEKLFRKELSIAKKWRKLVGKQKSAVDNY